jgi:hypothetical protein
MVPRRIEEIDVLIMREPSSGRLGFGIDQMNTVVEVDPKGPVGNKLSVGDKIVAVNDELLNFRKFVEVIGPSGTIKLRIARLRAASAPVTCTAPLSMRSDVSLSSDCNVGALLHHHAFVRRRLQQSPGESSCLVSRESPKRKPPQRRQRQWVQRRWEQDMYHLARRGGVLMKDNLHPKRQCQL